MDNATVIYAAYMLLLLLLVGASLAVPLLAFGSDMRWAYDAFGVTCHQKLSRSLCVFEAPGTGALLPWISDCTPQNGTFVNTYADRSMLGVLTDFGIGYKMPICARDFGIYGAMLLAGAIYPFVRRIDERRLYPAIWLILAMVPIGLDGGIQLLSDMRMLPFAYESTNALRLLTGAIAGGAATFYAIPLLVNLFSADTGMPGAAPSPAPSKTQGKANPAEKALASKK